MVENKEKNSEVAEAEKVTAELVESDEDKLIKKLEPIVAKTIVSLERKDYRALTINTQDRGQVPDAATAFIDISEKKVNQFGYNRDLDVKGNVNNFQVFFNQSARFLSALAELKDWEYIMRPDQEDETKLKRIEVDLVQLDAEEGRYLSMSLFGAQSTKEINLMRAVAGFKDDMENKVTGFLGLTRRKKEDVYQEAL